MTQNILITGTSNGFGNDTAKTLAAAGHRVFASMRNTNGANRAAADELRAAGIEVLDIDVTRDASVEAGLKAVLDHTDRKLDVLINNAGLAAAGLSETFTANQLREMFEVNVIGVQRVLRAALPGMRANKSGLVINVGSILGRLTIPFFGLYGATKFAIEAINDTYRYELSQLGVDVVLVQPGPFATKLYSALQTPADGARAAGYGDVAGLPNQVSQGLGGYFQSENAHDPHEFAEAVAKLIATPAGQRPDRVVVGSPFGADAANTAIQPLQKQMVAGFGLDGLGALKLA
jgi:NADP-dependent 3-hydroxy acid dehydrogenase YdfG